MKVTPVGKRLGRYVPGDAFELPEWRARALIKANLVSEVVEEKPKRQYRRRDLQAEA